MKYGHLPLLAFAFMGLVFFLTGHLPGCDHKQDVAVCEMQVRVIQSDVDTVLEDLAMADEDMADHPTAAALHLQSARNLATAINNSVHFSQCSLQIQSDLDRDAKVLLLSLTRAAGDPSSFAVAAKSATSLAQQINAWNSEHAKYGKLPTVADSID